MKTKDELKKEWLQFLRSHANAWGEFGWKFSGSSYEETRRLSKIGEDLFEQIFLAGQEAAASVKNEELKINWMLALKLYNHAWEDYLSRPSKSKKKRIDELAKMAKQAFDLCFPSQKETKIFQP